MVKKEMKMSVEEIKDAIVNPELIKLLHSLNISNQWGNINGRQLLLDVYRLCEQHEEIKKELDEIKKK